MPIQILPAQLANQIAAGEVVERPASVVKELIENSLDAGATRIDIEIDKGGSKRILIRDNGSGIAKEQLELALSRHATSKITDFDDLEQIATLGFRGEALASISSVSRLSLSSRPEHQEQAWQAQAQGRDMQVTLQPTAHPVGTSIEVLDLFFNTPARRKFLRTDKTEFSHIDELLKRLALSRFDVALSLKHNGKLIRQYRIATTETQKEKRLAAVMGSGFAKQSVYLENQHDHLSLRGWLGLPEAGRAQTDQQYFYVNGRMMRDKLLQHAIRQSYAECLDDALHPAYVLYLDLPLEQVDVNVHPAKHEVRFHQARLVHDYVVSVLYKSLHSQLGQQSLTEGWVDQDSGEVFSATEQNPSIPHSPAYESSTSHDYRQPLRPSGKGGPAYSAPSGTSQIAEQNSYVDWLDRSANFASDLLQQTPVESGAAQDLPEQNSIDQTSELRAFSVELQRYALVLKQQHLCLLDCHQAQLRLLCRHAEQQWAQGLSAVPLLLPVRLALPTHLASLVQQHEDSLKRLGFAYSFADAELLVVRQVPRALRQQNLAKLLPAWLESMSSEPEAHWQDSQIVMAKLLPLLRSQVWELEAAGKLLLQLEAEDLLGESTLWRQVDLSAVIESFSHG